MGEHEALQGFLDKWRSQWPEWRVAESFVPGPQRERAREGCCSVMKAGLAPAFVRQSSIGSLNVGLSFPPPLRFIPGVTLCQRNASEGFTALFARCTASCSRTTSSRTTSGR